MHRKGLKPLPYMTAVKPNTVLYCIWRFGMVPYEQFMSFYSNPVPDVSFRPYHVLQKGYLNYLINGRFKPIFGTNNQLNWFDIGQRWTLKPAVLKPAYR
jgi:hypothetical protein